MSFHDAWFEWMLFVRRSFHEKALWFLLSMTPTLDELLILLICLLFNSFTRVYRNQLRMMVWFQIEITVAFLRDATLTSWPLKSSVIGQMSSHSERGWFSFALNQKQMPANESTVLFLRSNLIRYEHKEKIDVLILKKWRLIDAFDGSSMKEVIKYNYRNR